jgi:hypothetical protein
LVFAFALVAAMPLIASACASGTSVTSTSVPVSVQQDPSGHILESAVTCDIEQQSGFQVVVAAGTAKNVGTAAVYISPQASFNNAEGQQLTNVGADSTGAVAEGRSWAWMAREPVGLLHDGVTDLRVVRCVVSTFVTT